MGDEATNLRRGRDVEVPGDLPGESVHATRTLGVAGAIRGGGGARCYAGGSLRCGEATGATLVSGGDVRVERTLGDSRTCAAGVVDVGGAIVGGRTSGNAGVRCDVAGAADGTPTLIAAGVDLHFAAIFARHRDAILADFKLAASTRAQVEPLMARLKSLSSAERESVTVSLCEADQLLHSARSAVAALRSCYEASRARRLAEIRVGATLHAGVSLQLEGRRAVVFETITGPLRVVPSGAAGVLALIVLRDGEPDVVLPATTTADPAVQAGFFFAECDRLGDAGRARAA